MSDIGDVAAAVGVGFAALAAAASWVSVRQGQRVWRASVEPDLHPQILKNARTNPTDLVIFNAGGGIAKGATFALVASGQRVAGVVGDGFMQSGDKVFIHTDLALSDDAECVVMYRSPDESSWAVPRAEPVKRLRKGRRGGPTSIDAVWRTFYPHIDFKALPQARYEVTWQARQQMS